MDLISLGLRYLNLIIVMAKDGISVYIYIWALISSKNKTKKNPCLSLLKLHMYLLMEFPFASTDF